MNGMMNGMMGAPLPMMGGSFMADMATMGMPAMSHMALSSMAMPGEGGPEQAAAGRWGLAAAA